MENKTRRLQYNAPVTLTYTFMCLGVLLLGTATHHISTKFLFSNYKTSFLDPFQYIRLFTHILGHINWEHFSGNFLIILLLGPMLEEKYGSKSMVEMIMITAFVTGILNTILFDSALLGASGIVFMMILLSSFANAETGKIPLTLVIVVIIFLGKEVVSGIFIEDNVSQITHIIGGLCGGAFGYRKIHS
ncbi:MULTISPECIES: rhomboid family intramembrane serine protease [Clostridium]|uniref:Rhomboid protease GlpG n=1 Tax=Clostridium colicanis DSM 13634 TaxID=1121305 RepID=A0A151APM0_9CLOT|nr:MULTISPECIES: rhomboid family intramembrane serine protease [Clostridium]KYH29532.1 rhomboid protease GlpG [Clostridium colicanis DSM 13634]MBE6043852.1 rhomboid family intramembrane serine protease [Clostridium thermopalmarium]